MLENEGADVAPAEGAAPSARPAWGCILPAVFHGMRGAAPSSVECAAEWVLQERDVLLREGRDGGWEQASGRLDSEVAPNPALPHTQLRR